MLTDMQVQRFLMNSVRKSVSRLAAPVTRHIVIILGKKNRVLTMMGFET